MTRDTAIQEQHGSMVTFDAVASDNVALPLPNRLPPNIGRRCATVCTHKFCTIRFGGDSLARPNPSAMVLFHLIQ